MYIQNATPSHNPARYGTLHIPPLYASKKRRKNPDLESVAHSLNPL